MYMIFVCPYLYVSDFVTLLNLETYLLQSFFHIFGQYLPSVLYRTNEVVQHQILVMTFYDMFGHSSIIPPPPRSRAARKSFLLYTKRKPSSRCLFNSAIYRSGRDESCFHLHLSYLPRNQWEQKDHVFQKAVGAHPQKNPENF